MSYLVNEQTPPQFSGSVAYWSRSADPFHVDAFKGIDLQGSTIVTIGGAITGGTRKLGWMAIDWCENPIGFVPDGHQQDGDPPAFEMRPSDLEPRYIGAHRVAAEVGRQA